LGYPLLIEYVKLSILKGHTRNWVTKQNNSEGFFEVQIVEFKPIINGIVVTVLIGSIFIFIPFLGSFERIAFWILAVTIGGAVTAYTTKGTSIDGGVHAVIVGIIGWYLIAVIVMIIFFYKIITIADSIGSMGFVAITIGGFLFGLNFGIIGAVIGNSIKKYQINKNFNGYLVCDKCGAYYELQEEESSDDFSMECECGGHLQHKKTIQPPKKYTVDKKITGVGFIMAITGAVLLFAVFQYQMVSILKIAFTILAVGLWISCVYIFNLY